MSESSHFSEQERADLVAYLDGELSGTAARALEAKLSLNSAARAEADALRRTWELLDFLPRSQPSSRFTRQTLQRLTPIRTGEQRNWRRWRMRCLGLSWAAALLMAGWCGYAGYNWIVPRQPGERELLQDLRILENKRIYERMEDVDFWRALDTPELFGEESLNP
ncbi:MAG: anti-sigma factor family protein [Gemmataceae bacterium]